MENAGRLYTQVAAAARVSPERALLAVYLQNLSRAGKSIVEAASLSRLRRAQVRDVARDWGFTFQDYSPAPPLSMVWEKVKRGEWTLRGGEGRITAILQSDGEGAYTAAIGGTHRCSFDGSSPEVAARRLARHLDDNAEEIFGVDDILIQFTRPDGSLETLAPTIAENPAQLRCALGAE